MSEYSFQEVMKGQTLDDMIKMNIEWDKILDNNGINNNVATLTYADGRTETIPKGKSVINVLLDIMRERNGDEPPEKYYKYLQHMGIIMLCLCMSVKSKDNKHYECAEYFIKQAEYTADCYDGVELYDVITSTRCDNYRDKERNEYDYQWMFKKYAHIIFPKCEVVTGELRDSKNIPDAWIKYEGNMIPVEVKYGDFDDKALKQLQRYISAFNAKSGVAVGKSLTVDIPENIYFVPNSVLEELNGDREKEQEDLRYLQFYKDIIEQVRNTYSK